MSCSILIHFEWPSKKVAHAPPLWRPVKSHCVEAVVQRDEAPGTQRLKGEGVFVAGLVPRVLPDERASRPLRQLGEDVQAALVEPRGGAGQRERGDGAASCGAAASSARCRR